MTILPELEKQLVQAAASRGATKPDGRSRRLGVGRFAGSIALAAGVGAVAAVVVVIASAGGRSVPSGSGTAWDSGAAALDRAARAAAAGALTPRLRPGQAWYTQERKAYVSPALASDGLVIARGKHVIRRYENPEIRTFETWGRLTGSSDVVLDIGGVASGPPGFGNWSALLPRPSALRNPADVLRLMNGRSGGYWHYSAHGGSPVNDLDTSPFTRLAKAAALLGAAPLSPAARATVFRALAKLPELTYLGATHDPLGRPGVAVAAEGSPRAFNVKTPQRYRLELIFDPSAGGVLGYRTIAIDAVPSAHVKAGALLFAWAYQRAAVVPTIEIPSLICSHDRFVPSNCQTTVRQAINKHH